MLQSLRHQVVPSTAAAAKLVSFAKKLEEAERVLDMLVDDYADYRSHRPKRSKLEDTAENTCMLNLSDVISYAHKISHTTIAPPAPQEDRMRASQLYAFADLDVGLPKTTIEPLMETPVPDPAAAINEGLMPLNFSIPVPPPGWQPGMPVELPMDLPLPPPGWQPGDVISLPTRPPPLSRPCEEVVRVPYVDLNILGDTSDDDMSSDDEDY